MGLNLASMSGDGTDASGMKAGLNLGGVVGLRVSPSSPVFLESGFYYTQRGGKDGDDKMTIKYYVQPVAGLPASEASSTIGRNGISTIYGTSDMTSETVIGFTYPGTDAMLYGTGVVIMYPTTVAESEMLKTTVPNLSGKSAMECISTLKDMNLNCTISGDITGICTSQGESPGTEVLMGTIVSVNLEPVAVVTPTPAPTPITGMSEDGVAHDDGGTEDGSDGQDGTGQDGTGEQPAA